jgi:hypothetical protein
MKGTIKYLEPVQSSSGNTYTKISLEEPQYANRKMITFAKEKLEVGSEIEFTYKENGDSSWVITPKKAFNNFSRPQVTDYKAEALKATIELIKADKLNIDQLDAGLKKIYATLNSL